MRNILLLVGFLSGSITAQAQNTFEKVIDTLGSSYAFCIKETFDGGYVFSGTSSYNGNDAMIVKLDSVGTIEWAKVYSGFGIEQGGYIEQTPDSGYIVNASYDLGLYTKSWLLRLDVNGDTLWTKTFSVGTGATNVNFGNSMATVNNILYGFTGYFQPQPFTNNSAYFLATLNNGTLLASKIYNTSSYGSTATAITKTYDGGFMMAGYIATSINSTDFYAIRVNSFGDTLWTKTYDNSPGDLGWAVQQTADSGFIVAGNIWNTITSKFNFYLLKTDSAGDTLWTKLHYSSISAEVHSAQQTADGGYVIGGTIVFGAPLVRQVYVMKTDANGDTLLTRHFGGNSADNGYYVSQTKDGGYLICGSTASFGNGGTYIIKTDSMGNVLTGLSSAEVNNPFDFSVFPNPNSGVFSIRLKGLPENKSVIEIYDLSSHCIYNCEIKNCTKEQIDLSHMPSGMYLIILRMKDSIVSRKIVIEKNNNSH